MVLVRECRCKWDGNLDGRLMRCAAHQKLWLKERAARKAANQLFKELMQQ